VPRRTYSKRDGRYRRPGQRTDWTWLVGVLDRERRWRTTPQTPGYDRRRTTQGDNDR
jgi:hypothetical protein